MTFENVSAVRVVVPASDSGGVLQAYAITQCGDTITAEPIRYSVIHAPRITSQPRSTVQLLEGSTLVLTVVAEASQGDSLRYEWIKDGQPLPDSIGSGPVLTIPNVTRNDRGIYQCRIIGRCQAVLSDTSTVDVVSSVADVRYDELLLLPQPAHESLSIITNREFDSYAIVDILGRTSLTGMISPSQPNSGNRTSINISSLPSGVYDVQLYRNGVLILRSHLVVVH
jgi:hypothetical protein